MYGMFEYGCDEDNCAMRNMSPGYVRRKSALAVDAAIAGD